MMKILSGVSRMTIEEQIKKKEQELFELQRLKEEQDNGLLARVKKIVANSGCCDWSSQKFADLKITESTFHYGEGVRIDFPSVWSTFELCSDLQKGGFQIMQVSFGEYNMMNVREVKQ